MIAFGIRQKTLVKTHFTLQNKTIGPLRPEITVFSYLFLPSPRLLIVEHKHLPL